MVMFGLFLLLGCSEVAPGEVVLVDTVVELPAGQFEAYETADYRIYYPVGWKVKREFTSDIASTTDVAFTSDVKELFFTPVATVSRVGLGVNISALDFGLQMLEANEDSLLNYEIVDRREIIANGVPVILITYTGKQSPESELIEFTQAFFVKEGFGFSVTGARDIAGDPLLAERLFKVVSSFRFL